MPVAVLRPPATIRALSLVTLAACLLSGCGTEQLAPAPNGQSVLVSDALPIVTRPAVTLGPDADARRLAGAVSGSDLRAAEDAAVAIYAQVGVVVLADDGAPLLPIAGTPSVVTLMHWQVHNQVGELLDSRRQGLAGTDIDRLAPMPDGAPPFAYVVAAWISQDGSRAAALAHAVMGERDWRHASELVYPLLVLALFSSDVAGMFAAESAPSRGGAFVTPVAAPAPNAAPSPSPVAAAAATSPQLAAVRPHTSVFSDPCGTIIDTVNSSIDKIAQALQIDPSRVGAGLQPLVSIWNVAVSFFASVAKVAVSALAGPVLMAIRTAVGVASSITSLVSLLKPWHARLDLTPSTALHFAIDKAPDVTGTATMRVARNANEAITWPPQLTGCATVAMGPGFEMPQLGVTSEPVEWTVRGNGAGVVTVTDPVSLTNRLLGSGDAWTAELRFTTGRQSGYDAASGDPDSSLLLIRASLRRSQLTRMVQLVRGLLSRSIVPSSAPQAVHDAVSQLLDPVFKAVEDQLQPLFDVSAKANLTVYHAAHVTCTT